MTGPGRLSTRGARAAATPLRIDHDTHRRAVADRYHPTDNPDGKLPLNVAENRLSWPDLKARIERVTAEESIPDWVPGYASSRGAFPFRAAAARFLAEHLTGCPIDPAHLSVSAGATGVIEMTSFVLADAGDVAVIPAPCYPVYRRDMGNFAGVERYDLVTHHDPSEIARGPVLGLGDLERARGDIQGSGKRFRMLILTTPDNPTGGIHPIERLDEIADWCIERRIHLVVNEIYGLSLIDTEHPDIRDDYPDEVTFTSFANLMAEKRSDYLHLWYALSKDLGVSGLRLGLVHSRNAAFNEAYANLNLTHSVSNHTQWVMGRVLDDSPFMATYIARNQERLTESYALAVGYLKRLAIPYVPSRGSLFLWIDLSELMEGDSDDAELGLWRDLFDATGVLLTPGVGFGHTKRGLFRMVYPSVSRDELEVAMERLAGWVGERRAG